MISGHYTISAGGVESKYRELTNRLEIEAFNCIKPVSIRQEFFAVLFLSNLAAILKKDADSEIIVSAENEHKYRTNRSYILNRIKSHIIFLLKHLYTNAAGWFARQRKHL